MARADDNVAKLMSAAGGPEAFLDRYRVILAADHGQSAVEDEEDPRAAFADLRLFVAKGRSDPDACDVAISASNRAAMVYRLSDGAPPAEELALRLAERPSVDVVAWREDGHAVALRGGRRIRFAPGAGRPDRRGQSWALEGDPSALELTEEGTLDSPAYPNPLERLWSLLACVNAGEVVASATPGFEFLDAGGQTHLGGGSHGSLHAVDSLVPLAFSGSTTSSPPSPSSVRSATWPPSSGPTSGSRATPDPSTFRAGCSAGGKSSRAEASGTVRPSPALQPMTETTTDPLLDRPSGRAAAAEPRPRACRCCARTCATRRTGCS